MMAAWLKVRIPRAESQRPNTHASLA